MKRTLQLLGAVALLLWTGLGFVAWSNVARRVTVVSSDEEHATEEALGTRISTLADELAALHQDVRALAEAMGTNLQALHDGLLTHQDERADAIEFQVAALRDEAGSKTVPFPSPPESELAGLRRELGALRETLAASAAPVPAGQLALSPEPVREAAPVPPEPSVDSVVRESASPPAEPEPAVPAAAPKKSFLAFTLPSDDFRFDERRTWALLPALSRIGFDAKTTLHDFTATTSSLEGELEADLAHPAVAPQVRIRVQAASLVSGNAERDEVMHEHLAVADHPRLEFELTAFEPDALDTVLRTASGRARGRMTVRGVTQEVVMPVRLELDDARRLCVEGEMPLDLTRFQVPVPNKLGLIRMDETVRVWISLRFRVNPRTEG